MLSNDELHKVIDDLNVDRKTTFAEFIAKLFDGKFIEIYLGDSYEEVSTEQVSQSYPAVFCGKVVGAYKEVLVINAAFIDQKTKIMKLGNLMFINERAIRALNEVDHEGILQDMFLRSRDTLHVLNNFGSNGKSK